MDAKEGPPELDTLQERLAYLFDKMRPAGKPRYTYRQASDAIREDQGFTMSGAYIHQLTTGERVNPRIDQVRALARFFGVPPGFLLGDEGSDIVAEQIERLQQAKEAKERLQKLDDAMKDPSVRLVALKARNLSPSHLGLVSAVLDEVLRLEGKEDDDPPSQ
ncbi:helix-turn-helix domain-containing protein [Actinoplanes sp. NPDC000266]